MITQLFGVLAVSEINIKHTGTNATAGALNVHCVMESAHPCRVVLSTGFPVGDAYHMLKFPVL